jgi:hypothetical protein
MESELTFLYFQRHLICELGKTRAMRLENVKQNFAANDWQVQFRNLKITGSNCFPLELLTVVIRMRQTLFKLELLNITFTFNRLLTLTA